MRLKFFSVPFHDPDDVAGDVNQFLAGHRILAIERNLVQDGANSAWAICITYQATDADSPPPSRAPSGFSRRGKPDYKEVLSPPEFAVYSRLRDLRKELAESQGVPVYALFTNEQLALMVQKRIASLAALRDIPGIGDSRSEKYGEPFLQTIRDAELPQPSEAEDATE
jgi:superfamily II DNA helicase RecQ